MKILFSGDWHLGLTTHSRVLDGVNTRTAELQKVIDHMVAWAIEHQVDWFVQMGDLFHRSSPSVDDLDYAMRAFGTLAANGIRCFIIDGNHDAPAQEGRVTPIALMRQVHDENVVVVEMGAPEKWPIPGANQRDMHLIPYATPLEALQPTTRSLVVGHTSLTGAVAGHEAALLSRYCMTEDPPDAAWVICGHLHKPQYLVNDGQHFVAYSGSIIQNDFGERGDQKGFLVWDEGVMEFHRTPHHELVQLDYNVQPWPTEFLNGEIVKVTGVVDGFVDTAAIERTLYEVGAHCVTIDIRSTHQVAARDENMTADQSLAQLWERYCAVDQASPEVQAAGLQVIEGLQ
jgi:DNA repair exonuclease SbcCD nuclease subunit